MPVSKGILSGGPGTIREPAPEWPFLPSKFCGASDVGGDRLGPGYVPRQARPNHTYVCPSNFGIDSHQAHVKKSRNKFRELPLRNQLATDGLRAPFRILPKRSADSVSPCRS